jgi:hypothetical protein
MQQQRSIGWGRNRGMDQPSHPAANGENDNQEQLDQRAQGSSLEAFSECHKVARVQGRLEHGNAALGRAKAPSPQKERSKRFSRRAPRLGGEAGFYSPSQSA